MKAITFVGPRQVGVETVEDPRIEAPTDCIVRMTSAAICGSDLHMYEGRTAAEPGLVFGHEPMGVVEQVGPALQSVAVGDRVVMPFNISCGSCSNCVRGYWSGCLTTNPDGVGAAYGYVGMGPHRGAQAELLRATDGDPIEQIREQRRSNRAVQEAMRPGEEKMRGVMSGIDAVGYQARSHDNPDKERQTQAIDDLAELVNPTGGIGLIGAP